jgi:DNA invertase Pin-like site-specific DNA recombinase
MQAAKRHRPGRLVGYARVSTTEQDTSAQIAELKEAGCERIYHEHGSGASSSRAELSRSLREISTGEVLVVVRLDRLARSVSHLLQVIEQLEGKGAHFRSLHDPIDTSTPQGVFALQVLGAVAQLERSLISERTKAGMKAAAAIGRKAGNPGLRERRPSAIQKAAAARRDNYMKNLLASADRWLPTVKRLRPSQSWPDVARVLNRSTNQSWTVDRLRRAVSALVKEGLADSSLLGRSPRRSPENRLVALISGIVIANPRLSLRDIAAQLEFMKERTPRGGTRWTASSVKNLLDKSPEAVLLRRLAVEDTPKLDEGEIGYEGSEQEQCKIVR